MSEEEGDGPHDEGAAMSIDSQSHNEDNGEGGESESPVSPSERGGESETPVSPSPSPASDSATEFWSPALGPPLAPRRPPAPGPPPATPGPRLPILPVHQPAGAPVAGQWQGPFGGEDWLGHGLVDPRAEYLGWHWTAGMRS